MAPEPKQLPRPSTSFVGRTTDLRAVAELVEANALVTLAGPGGAGKTRLALEVATRFSGQQGLVVRWVELADLGDPTDPANPTSVASLPEGTSVGYAVATSLGVQVSPGRDPATSVVTNLIGRRTLLCLDNAEHLLEPVAALVAAIVGALPDTTVLVTSREPLGLAGEVVWRVPPMPDAEAEALFVERAAAVRPSYRPDTADAVAIGGIVRHLDGIPLALELAAAWLGTLSPQQVLAGLDDRFRLLIRGPRNAQRRHQTLAGSISWSHSLLDPVDRAFFRRMSVFAGTFPLEAALDVGAGAPVPAGEELQSLARLVDKSLVMADPSSGVTRYRMLETIRAFAAARLAEAKDAASATERHLNWYVDLAEAAVRRRLDASDSARDTLRLEYVDLRTALDRSLDRDATEPARRLAASLAWLWHDDRNGTEGLAYLRRAIDLEPRDRSVLQARLLAGLALVADTAAPLNLEYDAAMAAVELATEVGDASLRGLCLSLAAVGAFYTDFDRAWVLADQATEAAPDDEFAQVSARALQSIILHQRDRHDEADEGFDEVVPRLQRLHRGIASTVLAWQAVGAFVTGDLERGLRLADDAVRAAEPLNDHLRVGNASAARALILARSGHAEAAAAIIEPLLHTVADSAADIFITNLPYAAGVVADCRGDYAAAAEWFRRGAAATDGGVDSWIAATSLAELGRVLVRIGDTEEATAILERAVSAATRLGMPRVLATARAAQAELAALDPDGIGNTVELDHRALAIRAEHRLLADLPETLEALARHRAALCPGGDDLRLGAAAEAARKALGLPRTPDEEARWSSFVGDLRAHLGDAAYDAARAEGEQLTLDRAVEYARRTRGSRARPSVGWDSLTPTELEVVALVADGLSNPEIAARLLMGRGTVKTHLAHIFPKLRVASRAELAAMASSRRSREHGGQGRNG